MLLGHVDTVHSHEDHRALEDDGETLVGSGSVDMKAGDVLALGVLRELAQRPELFHELALLLVCDEEWRAGPFVHTARFAGWDACLCFEGGELTADGDEAVVVQRKAAGTLQVLAHGRKAHSGSAPDKGANALLALASAAQAVAAHHDPAGADRLTAVPTVVNCGEAFNVVPGAGELLCDLRADDVDTFDTVLASLPPTVDGVRLESALLRRWPSMDSRAADRAAARRRGRAAGPRDRRRLARRRQRRQLHGAAHPGHDRRAGPVRRRRAHRRRVRRRRVAADAGRGRPRDHRRCVVRMKTSSLSGRWRHRRAHTALACADSHSVHDASRSYEHQTCIRRERALGFRESVISRTRAVLRRGAGEPIGAL